MTNSMIIAPLHELSPLQVHALYKLRVDIFVHEQQVPYAEIDDTDAAATTRHLLATDDSGAFMGVGRVYPSTVDGEDVLQFGRFAVTPAARGTGVARRIMDAALQLADAPSTPLPLYLTAQKPLTDYYRGYGFEVCGSEYDDEGVPHVPMIRR